MNNAAVGYYDMTLLLRYCYSVLFLSKDRRLAVFFFKTININGLKNKLEIFKFEIHIRCNFLQVVPRRYRCG